MGCHALLQGIFPTQGLIEPRSPRLAGRFFPTEPPGKLARLTDWGRKKQSNFPEITCSISGAARIHLSVYFYVLVLTARTLPKGEAVSPALEGWSLNHSPTGEVPRVHLLTALLRCLPSARYRAADVLSRGVCSDSGHKDRDG